jgi:hypothetical protein
LPLRFLSFSLRNLASNTVGLVDPLYNPRERPARGSIGGNSPAISFSAPRRVVDCCAPATAVDDRAAWSCVFDLAMFNWIENLP